MVKYGTNNMESSELANNTLQLQSTINHASLDCIVGPDNTVGSCPDKYINKETLKDIFGFVNGSSSPDKVVLSFKTMTELRPTPLNIVILFISVFAKISRKVKAPTLYKNTFSTNVLCTQSGRNKTQCSVE